MDEAITGADRERLLLATRRLKGDARTGEDVEDLLLRALEMERRREAAILPASSLGTKRGGITAGAHVARAKRGGDDDEPRHPVRGGHDVVGPVGVEGP